MAHHIIEYDEQCKSCKGTGIYVGRAERGGAGVVCRRCRGTGCHHVHIEYDDFEGLLPRDGITRVQHVNPGIVVGPEISRFGGLSYIDWLRGAKFLPGTEDRLHVCPAWWYQIANYDLKPHWDECIGIGCFSDCHEFGCKAGCWQRWDNEMGQC